MITLITFVQHCREKKLCQRQQEEMFLLRKNLYSAYGLTHSWSIPDGYDTGIKVYNCVTKKKEALVLRNKHIFTWYSCGPTVYDSSHVGHASCYVKLDIIQRIIEGYFKHNLISVMNITDIDDKIVKKSNDMNCSYKDIAEKYEQEFWTDMDDLGVKKPDIIPRVTEYMDLIISFIRRLEENGLAYKAEDGSVYFHVQDIKNYGKLQNISKTTKEQKSKIKQSDMDFALWKSTKEQGDPSWESPWGRGRPGWHIECSALASHFLGSNIDVHAGGIDLRFPHHENEEAQSCAFHNTNQWVNYWLHTGHLQVNHSEKMSKSLKNTVSIQEMLRETSSEVFRMACIMSHYQSHMEYSKNLFTTAENVYRTFSNFINSCDNYSAGHLKAKVSSDVLNAYLIKSIDEVHRSFCDNFDTPSVLKTLNELVSLTNSMLYSTASSDDRSGLISVLAVKNFFLSTMGVMGLGFEEKNSVSKNYSDVMDILNSFRQEMRVIGIANKNVDILNQCDRVRKEVEKCGIFIKDHGRTSSWNI
ncbi:unnamed protein product [Phaedon cochleariae]|uniref:cysteine--tRNA ligase n=1 Tax=Phaedon cochleariae TaxID=80249 RepID=A0A9P0DJM5_PHACE|nr:unnamed protein product [Phaedon cochleariae]